MTDYLITILQFHLVKDAPIPNRIGDPHGIIFLFEFPEGESDLKEKKILVTYYLKRQKEKETRMEIVFPKSYNYENCKTNTENRPKTIFD